MRLGVFGGSFDPVHYGHLLLAETCREQANLDEVWFVPAAAPPHKLDQTLSSADHRLQMLKLAIAGHAPFSVCDFELNRGGVSFTVDTLQNIHQQRPEASIYFLMGADSLEELPTWREPARICRLATPLVVCRAGSAEPTFENLSGLLDADRLQSIQREQVQMPVIELSSTELRRRAAQGLSLRYRMPRAVEMYIRQTGLYQAQA